MLIILTLSQMVEKLGSTSSALFAELYEEYLPKVYRYIAYRINDVSTAEDLTSMVFEKALINFRRYDSQKARFSTWIFTIARNTLTDYFRTHQKRHTVTLEDPSAAALEGPSVEDQSERSDDVRRLKNCLARLTQQEQEILSFKFGAELTNRQIAAQLALSESNVAVIIFRAVRKMRDDWGGRPMGKELPVEQVFSENIDRLISGQVVVDISETDPDLNTALDFARIFKNSRPQVDPLFQANLKARLLQKLARQESELRPHWLQKLVPRRPVWQFVYGLAVILVIGAFFIGVTWRDGGLQPVAQAPVTIAPLTTTASTSPTGATSSAPAITASTTAASTATAPGTTFPATTAFPSTSVPSGPQGVFLNAEAATNKSIYAPGEPVLIEVKLKNSGAQPLQLAQFPPVLSLMASSGNPVLSFHAGQDGRVLAPGETLSFDQIWNQIDARGIKVPAGRYYLELEDIDLQGHAYKLQLSQPVSFEIMP